MSINARFLAVAIVACTVVVPVHAEAANDEYHGDMHVYVDPQTGRLISARVTDERRATAVADRSFTQDASRATDSDAADGGRSFTTT